MSAFILFFAGVLGACFASFLVTVAEESYGEWSWLTRRSTCVSCKRLLSGIDLVPIFSFLFFRGRCRTCQAPIPWRYPLVEVLLACLFVFAAWHALLGPHPFFLFVRDASVFAVFTLTITTYLLRKEVSLTLLLGSAILLFLFSVYLNLPFPFFF